MNTDPSATFEPHRRRLLGLAYRMLGSVAEAEDAVQEAYLRWHDTNRDILVTASSRLVQTLLEHDLVDEVRLKVFPVLLGDGDRLFGATSALKAMRLVDARSIDGDTAYLTYVRKD